MSSENMNKHLALDERRVIEAGIKNGSSKTAIAETLGKDNSTIGKEIKLHRSITYKCALPMECDNYRHCRHERRCSAGCMDYVPFKCKRRDRSPGACNGCKDYCKCRFTKYKYDAIDADLSYRAGLRESRECFNLTTSEAKNIADVVAPLLKQGQSPFQIITDHPELGISEKTLYNYIEGGALSVVGGIANMDLRRQVSRKIPRSKKNIYKKRADCRYLSGRTYADYTEYVKENPNAMRTEMDTVYLARLSNGPIESLNRKVKDLKRNGRGYLTFDHIRNRFLFATRTNPSISGR